MLVLMLMLVWYSVVLEVILYALEAGCDGIRRERYLWMNGTTIHLWELLSYSSATA